MKKYLILMFLFSFQLFAQTNLCYSTSQFLTGIEGLVGDLEDIGECSPLGVGDSKIVDTPLSNTDDTKVTSLASGEEYKTPNAAQYMIRRASEDTYDIVFNLNFTTTDVATVTSQQMLERVQRCLEISSGNLYANGKNIRLIAISSDEVDSLEITPPQINIAINQPLGGRGNAQEYASDFTCSTITHELLHFLGLCDEYRENVTNVHESVCRSLGASDSLMGPSMNEVFTSVVGDMATCDLSNNPKHLSAIGSSNPIVREAALRMNFNDILSIHTDNIGNASNANPAQAYCTSRTDLPNISASSRDDAFSRIDEESETKLVLSSLFINHGSTPPTSVFTSSIECNCASVPASDQMACRRFIDIMRYRAKSIATPTAKNYVCPSFPTTEIQPDGTYFKLSRIPLEDLDLEPGEIKIDGNKVSFREQPLPTRSSLIYPAHLERIIQGSCETTDMPAIVNRYNQCARFSRKHSHDGKTCADKPAFCEDTSSWLGARE